MSIELFWALVIAGIIAVIFAGIYVWRMVKARPRADAARVTVAGPSESGQTIGEETMGWSDLTDQERQIVGEYVRLLRAWCGEQARTNNHGGALNDDYAQVQPILATLSGTDIINDGSGLAGCGLLTVDEVVGLTAQTQGILVNYNSAGFRQMWAKAAGPSNLIG